MKKQTVGRGTALGLLVLLAAALSLGTVLERQQQGIAAQLIRLHVVANSDSEGDQRVKLAVRDAVLAEAGEILETAASQSEAKALLQSDLDRLTRAANDTLEGLGDSHRAEVTLGRELFGLRRYGDFSLPGGYYDALRVSIGAGEGKNWWCVVYPQICTAAVTEDGDAVTAMGGLSEAQAAVLEGETPEYRFKFRLLELLENLLGWVRGGRDGIPVSG